MKITMVRLLMKLRSLIILKKMQKYRSDLIEAVAGYDEGLFEKFFEDPDSISEDEIHNAIQELQPKT